MGARENYGNDGSTPNERCPECDDSFLAEHNDRFHCGKCSYTRWK
ncbi:MAG TPA: 30S ribosomal protein S27ae [Halobacteriales archaeon]|jgi:small subunit ribosomal protein S27Ae|nr:30S ribosomal protein S27ae [Halobacteriales archaeon]HII51400.1 30S ribosomal protein S27ae [Halobacteriales archaeon]HIJ12322.1 30S ribosomal protein S27ae [Halobacteriales archaeon]